jgi:hypothetical protein
MKEQRRMPKPPKATPHSDIDGVHEGERPNTDVAAELGQGAEDLKRARDGNVARPPYSDDEENKDNRAR